MPGIRLTLGSELFKDKRIGACAMRQIRGPSAPQPDYNFVGHFAATSLYLNC